jgi:SAM-dependent methyltransferase
MKPCPICGSSRLHSGTHRDRLPVLQNVVWPTREAARAAPSASFTLATCEDCGFSFNGRFESDRIVYDERYDNAVPTPAFRRYYQSLIDMLVGRLELTDGTVYDVGCGKGEFLEMLCASVPGVRGIGIDPSCTPVERDNFRLIRTFLEPSHFAADTKLVIVRHVLEHIESPVGFLAMLRGCVPDVPVFVEVPDLGWILREGAFWDFCYEHCNYFTLESLATTLRAGGFEPVEQQTSFDGQYQWAISRPAKPQTPAPSRDSTAVANVAAYESSEAAEMDRLQRLADSRGGIAIWGMATKGVMLSMLLGEARVIGGVDSNPGKQGSHAGGSGVRINPPEWLCGLSPGTPVLVMNPNYQEEIAEKVRELGAPVELMTV